MLFIRNIQHRVDGGAGGLTNRRRLALAHLREEIGVLVSLVPGPRSIGAQRIGERIFCFVPRYQWLFDFETCAALGKLGLRGLLPFEAILSLSEA